MGRGLLILASVLLLAGASCGENVWLNTEGPLEWQRELARVFPADVDRDGEDELIAVYRSPDQKRSLMEAIQVRTGKRLWGRITIPALEEDSFVRMVRRESIDDSRLLLATTVEQDDAPESTAIALHRLSDGRQLWSRRLRGTIELSAPILSLSGPRVLVCTEQMEKEPSHKTLHILNAADGREMCSVRLKVWASSTLVVGKWLLLRGYEAFPHWYFHVVSLTDCKVRKFGRLGDIRSAIVSHRGQALVFRKKRFHAPRLLLGRFDAAAGGLAPVEHHPKLLNWGRDESAVLALPEGLLRQHRPESEGESGRLALYDWPPAKTVRWTTPIQGAAGLVASAGNWRTHAAVFRALGGSASQPFRRFLPLLLQGAVPGDQDNRRRRLALLDLRDGRISWKSKPIVSENSPWARLLYRPGIGRPQHLIVLRYRPGGEQVPGLIWVLDGRTGKTLSVLDGSLQFSPWQVAGDRLFGAHPGAPQALPFVFDLRRRKLLLGADPKSRFASRRSRLEHQLGPLP